MRDPSRKALTAWALCIGVLSAAAFSASSAAAQGPEAEAETDQADVAAAPPSEAVAQMAAWVAASRDNNDLPYVIIDKAAAQVFVFGADGRLSGAAPALLGSAHGDDSVPGIGDRPLASILPEERTTPAGRFLARYGRGLGKEPVLWVDYDTSISMHPVVTSNPREHRLERMKTPTPDDNRITFGCINVPVAFYQDVVRPAFRQTTGIVYILPETRPLEAAFPAFRPTAAVSTAGTDGAS